MNIESDKIRIELTRLENISKIVQIELDNSELIGQYNFDRHLAVIESEDKMHLSIFDNSDNFLIGHVILAGLTNKNDSIRKFN